MGINQRGGFIAEADKRAAMLLIDEAVGAGSRLAPACEILGLDIRTLQRWRKQNDLQDKRRGPISTPGNKLSIDEYNEVIKVCNSKEYCNQSPTQIVPNLAFKGIYIASESTMYRILRKERMLRHRGTAHPKRHKKPRELFATGPNQLWSWDITYMSSDVAGIFYYMYMFMDVFSRKIVGVKVFAEQSAEHASEVITQAYYDEKLKPGDVVLHSDNGSPMKGATMLVTLQILGVASSLSRPSVSNDNPFSEALFKTVKYCQLYPDKNKPFTSLEEASEWSSMFANWYNSSHNHSGVNFVTPGSRHIDLDIKILQDRKKLYEVYRGKNPQRWSGKTRNCERVEIVYLNSKSKTKTLT